MSQAASRDDQDRQSFQPAAIQRTRQRANQACPVHRWETEPEKNTKTIQNHK
jgi:hypothetical protein